MSADSIPSSKTNIFQNKLIYCRHFRTYSRCAMFNWSDTVFRRRNVTRRRISNTVLQPRYWGSEADSPEVCRLGSYCNTWYDEGTESAEVATSDHKSSELPYSKKTQFFFINLFYNIKIYNLYFLFLYIDVFRNRWLPSYPSWSLGGVIIVRH